MTRMMRAAVFEDFGGPEVIVKERPCRIRDQGGPDQVEAAAMNHLDLWVRRGLPIQTPMPHIGGSDIAGVVDMVGVGMTSALGARVVVDPSLNYDWYEAQDRGNTTRAPSGSLESTHRVGLPNMLSSRPVTYLRYLMVLGRWRQQQQVLFSLRHGEL